VFLGKWKVSYEEWPWISYPSYLILPISLDIIGVKYAYDNYTLLITTTTYFWASGADPPD